MAHRSQTSIFLSCRCCLSVGWVYLRFFTGSQMGCSAFVTGLVFGGKSFRLDKCTQLSIDIPFSLMQLELLRFLYRGFSILAIIGLQGTPLSRVLRRTWSSWLICEETAPFHCIFFPFIFISWKLITLQYCSGFCHTLTWISHGFPCVPHPYPPSHLPLHPIPLGLPSAPALSTCLMHPTWAGDLLHP